MKNDSLGSLWPALAFGMMPALAYWLYAKTQAHQAPTPPAPKATSRRWLYHQARRAGLKFVQTPYTKWRLGVGWRIVALEKERKRLDKEVGRIHKQRDEVQVRLQQTREQLWAALPPQQEEE